MQPNLAFQSIDRYELQPPHRQRGLPRRWGPCPQDDPDPPMKDMLSFSRALDEPSRIHEHIPQVEFAEGQDPSTLLSSIQDWTCRCYFRKCRKARSAIPTGCLHGACCRYPNILQKTGLMAAQPLHGGVITLCTLLPSDRNSLALLPQYSIVSSMG